jgi:2-isopropylmalate synthase
MPELTIYDSTLRDGAQAEGISFSLEDKLMIARRLDDFGVDYIEGGWPNPTNPKDLEFFIRVNELELKKAKITAFGSTRRAGTKPEHDAILNTLLSAETQVIALFGKSWDLHVTDVLGTTLDENLRMIQDSIAFLNSSGREVLYDAEHYFDGYKNNPQYALDTLKAAEEGGAVLIVLCDTNGGCMPLEMQQIIAETKKVLTVPFGIHTHNDSGMATANTILAVQAGAVQVQGTINGYGERCGNANLCTILPNLKLKLGIDCVSEAQLKELMKLSRFVSEIANVAHDHRQAYVGESAFAHKGGAHVDGVIKNTRSFEHVDPERVGNERRFLLSDQAGGSAVARMLKKVKPGAEKRDPIVRKILNEVKRKEHQGYTYEAANGSFEILARKVMGTYRTPFETKSFRTIIRRDEDDRSSSEAIVELLVDGVEEHTVAKGDGPINALDNALRKALERFYPQIGNVHLRDYKVRVLSSSDGTAAGVRVLIESSDGKEVWGTVGASENIIEASWEALVDSLSYKLLKDDR